MFNFFIIFCIFFTSVPSFLRIYVIFSKAHTFANWSSICPSFPASAIVAEPHVFRWFCLIFFAKILPIFIWNLIFFYRNFIFSIVSSIFAISFLIKNDFFNFFIIFCNLFDLCPQLLTHLFDIFKRSYFRKLKFHMFANFSESFSSRS